MTVSYFLEKKIKELKGWYYFTKTRLINHAYSILHPDPYILHTHTLAEYYDSFQLYSQISDLYCNSNISTA